MPKLAVKVIGDNLFVGPHFSMSFQRTLRIPEDDGVYPLPPGLGDFPIRRVEDFADRVPEGWREHGGVFIPMYQREAMWLNFDVSYWRACAVKIAVGKVNAVTGEAWNEQIITDGPQDYVVCPDQPWLDGINAGDGYIRQFVAMPLGMGYTVEGQVTGKEEHGGLQIMVFEPKKGQFPDKPPHPIERERSCDMTLGEDCVCCSSEMGLGAGGKMRQEIYPDDYGRGTWDRDNTGRVFVHIVNSMMYREITGEEPPATPVTAKTYTEHGFPWFELYDEQKGDLKPSDLLSTVKPISQMDEEHGFSNQQDDSSVDIPTSQVKKIGDSSEVQDGTW